jgi:hypothetical protein
MGDAKEELVDVGISEASDLVLRTCSYALLLLTSLSSFLFGELRLQNRTRRVRQLRHDDVAGVLSIASAPH